MIRGRSLPIGLFALAVGLSVVIGLEISGRSEDAPPSAGARPATGERSIPEVVPSAPDRHASWLKEILARPLFNPDRHPIDVGVRGLPRLSGIVVAGSQRVAIFAGPTNGHPIVAQAGAHVGVYEVRAVGDDGVTVVGPEGISLVRPAFDTSKPPTPEPRGTNLLPARPAPK